MSPLHHQAEGRERNAPADRCGGCVSRELLVARRQIAIIWSVEDVQQVRPDLDDDQSWEVLQHCQKWHDANDGVSWDTLRAAADACFETPAEEDAT